MRKNFGTKPWFYPLPVLIIGTYDSNNQADAMNAAWGGLYDANLVELCLSAGHKTTKNIKEKKAFTVSFADAKNVVACDYVGMVSANNTPDKMEKVHGTRKEYKLVEKYGDRLCFFGGIAVQSTLPYGTPDEIRREIDWLKGTLGRGGGWLSAPTHHVQLDTPMGNFFTMLDALGIADNRPR